MTIRHIPAVDTPYAYVINTANGEWYNTDTTSFETFNGSNLADYAVPAGAQIGTTGIFPWTFPSGIAAGQYSVLVYDGDDDSLVEAGVVDWTGTALKIEPNLGATAPTDWIKPAAIQDGAFTAAKFASGAFDAVWSVSTRTLSSFGSLVADIYSYFIDGARADAFKADVSGLSTYDGSDTTGTTTLLSRLSSTRAGYLDKLNVSGTLAHSDAAATYQADVSGLSTFDASSDTVTVGTNNDKTGYSLVSTGLDAITAWAVAITGNITGNLSGSVGSVTAAVETDSASRTASQADVSGLAEKTDLPTNFAAMGINVSGHVSRVTLVDTTTTNTDMRGTDSAYTGTPPTQAEIYTYFADGTRPNIFKADVSGLATSAQIPANFAALGINESGHLSRVTLVDTTTANSDMRGTDGANTATPLDAAGTRTALGLTSANLDTQLGDIPTVTEFNARSLPADNYFVVGDYTVPPTLSDIRNGLLRTGVTYRHTNASTSEQVDVTITETP